MSEDIAAAYGQYIQEIEKKVADYRSSSRSFSRGADRSRGGRGAADRTAAIGWHYDEKAEDLAKEAMLNRSFLPLVRLGAMTVAEAIKLVSDATRERRSLEEIQRQNNEKERKINAALATQRAQRADMMSSIGTYDEHPASRRDRLASDAAEDAALVARLSR